MRGCGLERLIIQTAVLACAIGMTRAMAVAVAMIALSESVSDASR